MLILLRMSFIVGVMSLIGYLGYDKLPYPRYVSSSPCTSLELFNLATKCARAEEGRLSLPELPAADPEEKKPKAKDVKRKEAAVLAAELDTKRGKDLP